MAMSISYTYKIIDKYTPKLREIQKQTQSFNKTLRHAAEASKIAGKNLQSLGGAAGVAARSVNRATGKMNAGVGGFGKRVDSVNGKLNKFGRSAGGLATSVGGFLLFRKATKDSFAYEQSLTDLTKVFDGLTGDKLKSFSSEMTKVGGVIAQSKTGMNQLAFAAGKLGIPLKEVGAFGELAGKVAVAFDIKQIGEAGDVLGNLRVRLGLNNNELAITLDAINAIADGTNAKVKKVLKTTERLAGDFKSLQVPPEVAAGFAAVASQLEDTPQRAAGKLRIMMQRLRDPKIFGGGMEKALGQDFAGTMNKILGTFRKMDRVKRNQLIQKLFGPEVSSFVMNLVDSQEVLNKTLGIAGDKIKNLGSVNREFIKQTKTGNFAIQQMNAANEDLSATLGDVFRPVLKKVIKYLTGAARAKDEFAKKHPGIAAVALSIAAIATIAAPAAIAIAGTSAALLWLSKVSWIASSGMWVATTSMKAFSVAMAYGSTAALPLLALLWTMAAPFVLIAAGVSMVAVGLAKLWQEGGLFGWVNYTIRPMVELFDRLTGLGVADWLDKVANKTSNLADSALGSVGDFLGFGDDEQSINVKKQTSNQTNVNGSIRVEAEPGTKATGGGLKSSSPGNLGMNMAGAT